MTDTTLAKSFEPQTIEAQWGPEWEKRGYAQPVFAPDAAGAPRANFSIQLPPPNVTGTLHMGHAFNQTIMDSLTRYHRMRGDNTLWLPGTDHAGIATQIVVERQLDAARRLAPRPGPREVRRTRLGVEAEVRLDHHEPDAPPGRVDRLVARILHDGREDVDRRQRGIRASVRARPDLPRQAPRQLGPGADDRRLRPRSRERGRRRPSLAHPLSAGRRQRAI